MADDEPPVLVTVEFSYTNEMDLARQATALDDAFSNPADITLRTSSIDAGRASVEVRFPGLSDLLDAWSDAVVPPPVRAPEPE